MTRSEKFAATLMRPLNPTLIAILGIYTIVWGVWLANPFWTVFTQAPLYAAMGAFAGEWVWGSIAIAAGITTSYGAYKPSYANMHLGSFVAALHWLAIGIFYLMGDWQNTGGITSLCFAIYAGVVWLNVKFNKYLYIKDPP